MTQTKTTRAPFSTPAIPPEFVIQLKNKEYITANGLIYLGHLQGLRRITVEHLQLPTRNDPSAIVRCEVETELGTFADYGECGPANKGNVGGAYPLSMATTRARNRALRIATGCPLTSYEEIGAEPERGEEEHEAPRRRESARLAEGPQPAIDPALVEARAVYGRLAARLRERFGLVAPLLADDLPMAEVQERITEVTRQGTALAALSSAQASYVEEMRDLHERICVLDPGVEEQFRAPGTLDELRAYVEELRAAVAAVASGHAVATAALGAG